MMYAKQNFQLPFLLLKYFLPVIYNEFNDICNHDNHLKSSSNKIRTFLLRSNTQNLLATNKTNTSLDTN